MPATFERDVYERWLAADVFAPDGAGSTADPDLPPFVIIQPPPNVTGSLHLGHAQRTTVEDLMVRHARMVGPPVAVPAGPRPREHRGAVRARRDPREGGREPRVARARALSRADAGVRRRDPRGHPRPAAPARGGCDWGRLRYTMDEGSARAVRVAFERLYRDGLAYRTEALVNWCPGCRDERQRPRGHPDPRDRHALDGPLPPRRPGDGRARPGRDDLGRHDPARDDPRRHRRRRPSRRPALRGARRPAGADPVRRARRAGHRRRGRRSGVRDGRGEDHAAHDHDDNETGKRHGLPMPTILDDAARVTDTGRATTAWTATPPARGSWRTSRPAATSSASSRTRWSSAAASAATTSSSRASRPSGS